jgi:hypothetical protein
MKKERKHYTAAEKVSILRRHLLDKLPVSDLCEELGVKGGNSGKTAIVGVLDCGYKVVLETKYVDR